MQACLANLTMLAAGGGGGGPEPFPGLKEFINAWSVPEWSLPIFTAGFVLMLVFYKKWTKPIPFIVMTLLFSVAYFGSMAIDHDYYLILAKPDNVPITMMLFGTGFFLWLAFRQAAINDDRIKAGLPLIEENKDDKVLVWPDLVYTELICIVVATVALIVWSILLRAPLEAPANPAGPPNPSKAPWYFLGLQEMLVYFDPWMAGVVLPAMIITGLIGLPYCDTNPKGNGYYTFRERWFIISTWMFGFLILWIVLIVFGTFLRGPNWNFFGPYEYWDSHMSVPLTNVFLSDYFWNGGNLPPFYIGLKGAPPANPWVREAPGIVFTLALIFGLPILMLRIPFIARLRQQMGPGRFWFMAIHFSVMFMMPVKMVLRWLLTLKYFVYLPEYNFNW